MPLPTKRLLTKKIDCVFHHTVHQPDQVMTKLHKDLRKNDPYAKV